eukprot:524010-Prorocentrum_minimum.AAC.2
MLWPRGHRFKRAFRVFLFCVVQNSRCVAVLLVVRLSTLAQHASTVLLLADPNRCERGFTGNTIGQVRSRYLPRAQGFLRLLECSLRSTVEEQITSMARNRLVCDD